MRFRYILFILLISSSIFAQKTKSTQLPSSSNNNEIPAIIQHLPSWEQVQSNAKLINNASDLRKNFPDTQLADLVKFNGGTEAATADYQQGKFLLIEYTNPQLATEQDEMFKNFLTKTPQMQVISYRRIGNYAAFVFNPPSEAAANELLDQIQYQKVVKWLGEDPYWYAIAERKYLNTTGDMLLSTFIAIIGGFAGAVLLGGSIGFFVYYLRKSQRNNASAFSDAGGMTRLNLDDLSDEIKLLSD
jgi:hypothetical protein